MSGVNVVWAREPIPDDGVSVFLAGPTPRDESVPTWRWEAIGALETIWARRDAAIQLSILTPESRGGVRAKEYDDQFNWETAAREQASAILFWIPRDLKTMPGFTTNVEFGLDVQTGRAVLGVPPRCPNPERNRYLIKVAELYNVPVRQTLPETAGTALAIATGGVW